jgi:hypothetical protein
MRSWAFPVFLLLATLPTRHLAADVIGFDIQLNLTGFSTSQSAVFQSAAATWESYILGYKDNINNTVLTITASAAPNDGVGGVLGSAGPTYVKGLVGGRFLYAETGVMSFDSADIGSLESNGSLQNVILHEMAHVIGIGSLWSGINDVGLAGYQELYVAGSGQYTGAAALAAWKSEFNQPGATFVPVELGGGIGTADGHWNEVDGGGSNTGIVSNITGQDFKYELMTGWLNSPAFISTVTLGAFQDLGYNLRPIPEPSTWLLAMALTAVAVRHTRRRVKA